MVVDVQKELYAPFMFVCKHSLDQLVRLVYDLKITHLSERDLFCLYQSFYNDDCVLIETSVVDLVKVSD